MWQDLDVLLDDGKRLNGNIGADVDVRGDGDCGDGTVWTWFGSATKLGYGTSTPLYVQEREALGTRRTNEYVISDLHGVVMYLASTYPSWGLDHASCGDDGAAPDVDAYRCCFSAGLGGRGPGGVQVAAKLDVSHYHGAAAERDVGSAGYGGAAGDFVAAVLWGMRWELNGGDASCRVWMDGDECCFAREKVDDEKVRKGQIDMNESNLVQNIPRG